MSALPGAERLAEEVDRLRKEAGRAVQDCVRDAERSVTRARECLVDARDEAVHHVKRRPGQSIAIAFAVGTVVGLVLAVAGLNRKT